MTFIEFIPWLIAAVVLLLALGAFLTGWLAYNRAFAQFIQPKLSMEILLGLCTLAFLFGCIGPMVAELLNPGDEGAIKSVFDSVVGVTKLNGKAVALGTLGFFVVLGAWVYVLTSMPPRPSSSL